MIGGLLHIIGSKQSHAQHQRRRLRMLVDVLWV